MWLVARDGLLEGAVRLWSYHWAVDGRIFYNDGSSTFSVCVSSGLLEDEREGRRPMAWHFPCDNKRTTLRTDALRVYEKSSELIPPGPRSRVGTLYECNEAVVHSIIVVVGSVSAACTKRFSCFNYKHSPVRRRHREFQAVG